MTSTRGGALLNYTTSIEASKTLGEIMGILQAHRVRAINTLYANDGCVSGLAFEVAVNGTPLYFKLPARIEAVEKVMEIQRKQGKMRPGLVNREQATRVAWRILKDWVEAQMALIDTGMVQMQEVFLPYMLADKEGRTVYEIMEGGRFLLAEPQ